MTFQPDHLIINVADLNSATAEYQALGFNVMPGGVHASGATHNALIIFQDGTYLELLALTGQPARPGAPDFSDWFRFGEGLVGYALRTDDLSAEVAAMLSRGIQIGDPQPGSRTRPDGTILQWQTAAFAEGSGTSITPFFIEDVTAHTLRVPVSAAAVTHPNGITGVAALNLVAVSPTEEIKRLQQVLGVSPYRSAPEGTGFRLNGNFLLTVSALLPGMFPPSDAAPPARPYSITFNRTPTAFVLPEIQPIRFNLKIRA